MSTVHEMEEDGLAARYSFAFKVVPLLLVDFPTIDSDGQITEW